jgi:diguanylate cyclase (GGDEF)-like protein
MDRYGNVQLFVDSTESCADSALLALAVSFAGVPMAIFDADHRIIWTNGAFTNFYGLVPAAGMAIEYAQSQQDASGTHVSTSAYSGAGPPHSEGRRRLTGLRADGSRFVADAHVSPFCYEGGAIHSVAVFYETAHSSTSLDEKKKQPMQDELTGLACRSHVVGVLESALETPPDHSHLLAVLFIDLDGFKAINDAFGHHIGDRLLKAVAARLAGVVRFTDIVARFGGDEFLVLLPAVDGRSAARQIGMHIVEQLRHPFAIDQGLHHITASVGVAFYPDHGRTAESLLIRADEAMYRAKARGGNQLATGTRRTNLVQQTGFRPIQSINAAFRTDSSSRRQRPPHSPRNG